jgi:hypothetical protein
MWQESCRRKEIEDMTSTSAETRGETLERGSEIRALAIMVDLNSPHSASAESAHCHLLFCPSDLLGPHFSWTKSTKMPLLWRRKRECK